MRKLSLFALIGLVISGLFLSCSKTTVVHSGNYSYEMVEGDPLKTRIYTLDNGLKVYMTVYKEAPRIQTAIAI